MPFEITPELPAGAPVDVAHWSDPANTTTVVVVSGPEGDAQWDDPLDGTETVIVPVGAEPQGVDGFRIAPALLPMQRITDSFIQWQSGGYNLGDAKALVVNFRYPLVATRGVGEHENVITVGRVVAPPPPPPPPQQFGYFTSIIYPLLIEEALQLAVSALQRGFTLRTDFEESQVPVPSLPSGTLTVTISFLSYGPQIDDSQVPVPSLLDGTLVVTISYLSYGPQIDDSQVPVPPLSDGALVVVISFIDYTNAVTYPDNSQVSVPSLLSGTLV